MHRKALRRTVAVASGFLLAATMTVPVSATKDSDADVGELASALQAAKNSAKITGIEIDTPTTITAFVEVDTPTVVEATKSGTSVARAEAAVKSHADTVAKSIDDPRAQVLYTTENAVSGFVVEGDAEAIAKLAERDDVLSVSRMTEHTTGNSGSVGLTRAINAWQDAGNTGKDVKIAVIDSGVDFTHKTFGGAGDYSPYAKIPARQADVTWPQGKVIGGWDFVGEEYNGSGKGQPDANPIDIPEEYCFAPADLTRSGGHGSHVAGTAAGFGVTADGEQFTGDYATLSDTELQQMKVGPGTAPEAEIVAFKVFGCAGSTAYVMDALDELLAKTPDGKYKWDVDVVNMSLGGTYATSADPENLVVNKLFEERGIISVVAAGNSGDYMVIGGSPGNASSSLTVANTLNGISYFDVAQITGQDDGIHGQYSVNYRWETPEVGPLEIVKLNDTGCNPLTADQAALVKGKAAYLDWNSDDLECSSSQRFDNIEAAGGAGVVLEHQYSNFEAGIAGNEGIPGFQLLDEGSQWLNTALENGTVEITYTKAGIAAARSVDAASVDTLNNSSSRVEHGSFGVIKPDVAAPGTNIMSAAVGSGNGAQAMTGTSMATPHTAGILALTKAENPDWSPVQLKANMMNTAFHEVTNGSTTYGPLRVGSGRVDALAAVQNKVVMYDSEDPDLASVNFGIVEFPQAGYANTRKVTLENLGSSQANLTLGYRAATTIPGVSFSVSPTSVTIPAGAKTEVSVAVNVDAAAFQKTLDPTMALKHVFSSVAYIREYVATASGQLFASGVGAPEGGELHLPVSIAPKPASNLHGEVEMNADNDGGSVAINGETFAYSAAHKDQGELDMVPLAMAFQHVADSPQRPIETPKEEQVAEAMKATDIKTVGVNTTLETLRADNAADPSDAVPLTQASVVVGVETWGPWSALPIASQSLNLDVVANGKHFEVAGVRPRGTDIPVYAVFDENGDVTGLNHPNAVPGSLVDSNRLDTAVVAIPFSLESVGITEEQIESGNVDLEISVLGNSWYAPARADLDLDVSVTDRVKFTFNPTKAKFAFDTELGPRNDGLHIDGLPVAFTYDEQAAGGVVTAALEDDKIMLMHFHNKVGDQVEVLPLVQPEEPEPSEPPESPEPTDPPESPEPTDPPVSPEPTEKPDPTVSPEPTETPTAQPTSPGEPPEPWLPITGSNTVLPALFAAGLLGAGGVLIARKYAR